MARKRRPKTSAKRSNRRKSDSDQNSNGMSDENESANQQESTSKDPSDVIASVLQQHGNAYCDEYQYMPISEKNHKHPKFRYLERRHSSSNEEDAEFNTSDLMPQQIRDMILGDVKAIIISQDDIANDTCLQGHIEHEEVIGNSMDYETNEVASKPSMMSTIETFKGSSSGEEDSKASKDDNEVVILSTFENTVKIVEYIDLTSVKDNEVSANTSSCDDSKVVSRESTSEVLSSGEQIVKCESNSSDAIDLGEDSVKSVDELSKSEPEKKKSQSDDSGRRRSNRIRVNRWTDDDGKVTPTPEMQVPPPPPQAAVFDNDKPVKVKSRWRRTSELEMGSSSVSSFTSDSEHSNVTSVSLTSPDVGLVDPDVEEGLKNFEIITQNIFLTPRVRKERLVCECTLSKEEISKGEMGCGDDCLNRLLMIECGSRCILGNLCSNRQFQNCQYAPCQVIKTKKKGLGLVPTVNVSPGTFIMEYLGEVLESKEFRRRAKEYAKEKNAHYYFMQLESSHVIDATVKGNISRFINHSCDPNSETQKWTVNGELRIGFFSKKAIAAGEEITFDYKLDRYGREAQKCYCGAPNCRGWIGENPETEKEREKSSKKEKKEKKRREERKRDFISDRELEYEVEKLIGTGVKNQKHTLTLNRLMVRAEDEISRRQLLELTQNADVRCLRLFLDYHGLSLLWSYMVDSHSSSGLKLEILNTLAVLPISNRTVLQDSKVLPVVRRWAKLEDDSSKDRNIDSETGDDSKSPPADGSNRSLPNHKVPVEKDEELEKKILEKANDLLTAWDNLKHEYRIPKKERIEQMKEHEREANRGYCDPWEQRSHDRQWHYEKENRGYEKESRYNRDRKRGRESPSESDWRKSRSQDERHNGGVNRLTKTERRQLFALKVEEEDRQRKMEEDWAKQHGPILPPQPGPPLQSGPMPSGPPLQPGPPQAGPPPMDPNQAYFQPPPFHPTDGGEMVFGPPAYPPPYMGPPQPPGPFMDGGPPPFPPPGPGGPHPPPGFHPPPYNHPPLAPPYQPPLPSYPPFPYNPPPQQTFPPTPGLPAPSLPAPSLPIPAVSLPLTPASVPALLVAGPPPPPPPLPHVFPIKLPPKWRSAKDKEGRIYYYHTKTRKSQWQIPTEETVPPVSDTESDSEDSSEDDESSSTEDEDEKVPGMMEGNTVTPPTPPKRSVLVPKEEEDFDETVVEEEEEDALKKEEEAALYVPEETKVDDVPLPLSVLPTQPVLKKRREGLVEINIISPRDDEDDYRCGITKKQIREKKEQRAREKRKLRNSGAAKCVADSSVSRPIPKRKIIDMFKVQMANEVVAILNPYRKLDCKMARITNTEDFKYLARKLTHIVMMKELKHCVSIEELVCNDNVKRKAKNLIRKYMATYGPVYNKKSIDP